MRVFNISRREKALFLMTAAIIILALLYNFILEASLERWSNFDREIYTKRIELRKAIKLLQQQNEIITEYSVYASSITPSNLMSYIEKLSETAGIKTANLRPMPVSEGDIYNEYMIEVQIECEWPDLNRFITQLLKPPALITIKKFDLRRIENTKSRLKGTLTLSRLMI